MSVVQTITSSLSIIPGNKKSNNNSYSIASTDLTQNTASFGDTDKWLLVR